MGLITPSGWTAGQGWDGPGVRQATGPGLIGVWELGHIVEDFVFVKGNEVSEGYKGSRGLRLQTSRQPPPYTHCRILLKHRISNLANIPSALQNGK